MQLQEIKIFPWFEITKPSTEKMREKEKEFQETGLLPTEIILDDQNRLLDGYISYLLAVKYGLEDVPVKYGRRQVIKAHHKEHGKRYEWELPERLIDQVAAGDKVMIRNTRGLRWVIVDVVEEYGACEHPLGLRMVIKKKGEPRNKN